MGDAVNLARVEMSADGEIYSVKHLPSQRGPVDSNRYRPDLKVKRSACTLPTDWIEGSLILAMNEGCDRISDAT